MKTIVLSIEDDSKFHLLVSFLQEIRFVKIENEIFPINKIKRINRLSHSILHPIKVENCIMFSNQKLAWIT